MLDLHQNDFVYSDWASYMGRLTSTFIYRLGNLRFQHKTTKSYFIPLFLLSSATELCSFHSISLSETRLKSIARLKNDHFFLILLSI